MNNKHPDVPERPFQGDRTVQAPSCESAGVGKREELLIEVPEMSAHELIATSKAMVAEGIWVLTFVWAFLFCSIWRILG